MHSDHSSGCSNALEAAEEELGLRALDWSAHQLRRIMRAGMPVCKPSLPTPRAQRILPLVNWIMVNCRRRQDRLRYTVRRKRANAMGTVREWCI